MAALTRLLNLLETDDGSPATECIVFITFRLGLDLTGQTRRQDRHTDTCTEKLRCFALGWSRTVVARTSAEGGLSLGWGGGEGAGTGRFCRVQSRVTASGRRKLRFLVFAHTVNVCIPLSLSPMGSLTWLCLCQQNILIQDFTCSARSHSGFLCI